MDIEEKIDSMRLKSQLLEEELSIAQKKVLLRELKQKYGSGWKKVLGLKRKDETGVSMWEKLSHMRMKTEFESGADSDLSRRNGNVKN